MTDDYKNDVINKLRGVDYATLCNLLENCNLTVNNMVEIANGVGYSDAYKTTAKAFCESVKEYRELITIVINEKNR